MKHLLLAVLPALLAAAPAPPGPAAAGTPALDPARCDNRPVIMIVEGRLRDRERLAAYAAAIRASQLYERLGAYYINNPRTVATFEGDNPPERSLLLVRFPCYAHARAFWYSKRYQNDIVPLRLNPSAGEFTVTIVAENPPPAYMQGRLQPGGYSWVPGPEVAGGIEAAVKP